MEKEADVARIRQMAVAEKSRMNGVGRELILRIEVISVSVGYMKAIMHGRCEAQGFYKKLGYGVVFSVFRELGIPHVVMEKVLASGE